MGSSTPTPWARGDRTLSDVTRAQVRDSQQQRRGTVDVTDPDVFSSDGGLLIIPGRREMPGNAGAVLTVNADEDAYELAVPAAGGGSMQGFTRAKSFSTVWSTSTASCRDWDFDPTWDTSPAAKPSMSMSADTATFGPTEAGWYVTHHRASSFVATPGMLARVNFGSAGSGVDQRSYGGRVWLPATYDAEIILDHWSGPFWLPATASGYEPLSLDFQFAALGAAPSGTLQASIDVWRVG